VPRVSLVRFFFVFAAFPPETRPVFFFALSLSGQFGLLGASRPLTRCFFFFFLQFLVPLPLFGSVVSSTLFPPAVFPRLGLHATIRPTGPVPFLRSPLRHETCRELALFARRGTIPGRPDFWAFGPLFSSSETSFFFVFFFFSLRSRVTVLPPFPPPRPIFFFWTE